MATLYWTAAGFLSGSLMFSVWTARAFLGVDIRQFGDGNPGAGNVWRAGGGWKLGVPAALLDYGKAVIPVALAQVSGGVTGWALVPVGLAPLLGHAFSPLLGFRGGKGVAATFGIWTGLTGLGGPLAFGLTSLLLWRLQWAAGWTMIWGMAGLLVYLALRMHEAPLLAVWTVNAAIISWRHRHEFHASTTARPSNEPRTG